MRYWLLGSLAVLFCACSAQIPQSNSGSLSQGPSLDAPLGFGSESDATIENTYDMGPPAPAARRPILPAAPARETIVRPPLGDRATGLMPMPEEDPPVEPEEPIEPPAGAPTDPQEPADEQPSVDVSPEDESIEIIEEVDPAAPEGEPAPEAVPAPAVDTAADPAAEESRLTVEPRGPCCSPFNLDPCALFAPNCDPCNPCRRWYVTGSVEVIPGIGGGLIVGRDLKRATPFPGCVSAEIGYSYQTLYSEIDEEYGGGGIWQLRGGLKVDFMPRRGFGLVPYTRFGVSFMEVSGTPGVINNFGDWFDIPRQGPYLGAYGSLGLDLQLNRQFSTGIEGMWSWGENLDNGITSANMFVIRWNFTLHF